MNGNCNSRSFSSLANDLKTIYYNEDSLLSLKNINGKSSVPNESYIYLKDKIHVEICQRSRSCAKTEDIQRLAVEFFNKLVQNLKDYPSNGLFTRFENPVMERDIESVYIPDIRKVARSKVDISMVQFHIFQLSEDAPNTEDLGTSDEQIIAANHWLLPCRDFVGIWESLEFDSDIKLELMKYANTALLFSDKQVDPNIVTWNKVILFHGPPGTGKTSLCKALAQKLSIYLAPRYKRGQLVEINSHSLFSKWFSESGKLVSKMFEKIQEYIQDKDSFVMVLIDEVESLTAARKQAFKSAEPSDAIRVVNALLTQLDQIRRYPNVLIMTTSNITGAIDVAFIDRADIKQYIGPPSVGAIYRILDSCLQELMRTKIIEAEPILSFDSIISVDHSKNGDNHASKIGFKLERICKLCHDFGLSGRSLRKLLFLCYSNYILPDLMCDLNRFLDALEKQVIHQEEEKKQIDQQCKTFLESQLPKNQI